ncbi:MAG: hydrolase, partial [Acetobacteraceae bacterium]
MTDRLERQFAFLNEADALKHVMRATTTVDGKRVENSGEHSW